MSLYSGSTFIAIENLLALRKSLKVVTAVVVILIVFGLLPSVRA